MNRLVLIVVISIVFQSSCVKDSTKDYRNKFVGTYFFTVKRYFWSLNMYNDTIDTVKFEGTIKIYNDGDNEKDLSIFDTIKNTSQRLTIEFIKDQIITPEVLEDGNFREFSGYHYHHIGHFVNGNEIEFTVDRLGGLGSGYNYYIKGKRK